MKNFGKKLLIGTSVVAASAALGALLYKRYMDDFYEYVMDEDCMDEDCMDEMDEEMEFAESTAVPVAAEENAVTEEDFEPTASVEPVVSDR